MGDDMPHSYVWPDIGARVKDQQEQQKSYYDRRSVTREVSVSQNRTIETVHSGWKE